MSTFLVVSLIVVAILIATGLYRVWAGPTVFDRIVAVALVSVNGVVVLVLLGFAFEQPVLFLDIALGFALLAFLLPIALGRYFEARDDGTSKDGAPSPRAVPRPHGVVPHGLIAERSRRAASSGVARSTRPVPPPVPEAGAEAFPDTPSDRERLEDDR
jgi:multicomponent Na+:H+ antiporter subunit F